MSGLQKFLFYFSWLILPAALLLHLLLPSPLPFPLQGLLAVLLTGAIGFLTNFLAIEMLFKPYSPDSVPFSRLFSLSFWKDGGLLRIITLGFWKTGLVPANKPQIGKKLGEEIPRRLLNAETLSVQLMEALSAFPEKHPDFPEKILAAVLRGAAESPELLRQFRDSLANEAETGALSRLFAPAVLEKQLQNFTGQWFGNEENRLLLLRILTAETEKHLEYIRNLLRDTIQTSAAEILQKQSPLIAMFGGNMIDGLLRNYDWTQLDPVLLEKLHCSETQEKILQACASLPESIKAWAAAEDGRRQLADIGEQLRRQFSEKLNGNLPEILKSLGDSMLQSPRIENWMTNTLTPALQAELKRWFANGGQQEIISVLNLSGRIEEAVAAQDIREFHQMVKDVADRHLNAIQVLGFFIGLVIGIIQIL